MADELDLREMRLEIKQLRGEVARLQNEKFPQSRSQMFMFAFLWGLIVPTVLHFWVPKLGITGPESGRFSNVNAEGWLHAEEIWLENNSRNGVETRGRIETDQPTISLRSSEGKAIYIDADRIRLEGERGELILELNEKGEPELRSIPAKK